VVPWALSLGINCPGREADHSPPSISEVNAWSYISTLPIRLHGVVLSYEKAQEQLYLYCYLCIEFPWPPSMAEVKNAWSYTSTPPIRLHGVVLS